MKLGSQEHYDMIADFEKLAKAGGLPFSARLDKETKELWPRGYVYQHGELNNLFRVYCAGYANARCVYLQGGPRD